MRNSTLLKPFLFGVLVSVVCFGCGEDPEPKKDIEPNNMIGNNQPGNNTPNNGVGNNGVGNNGVGNNSPNNNQTVDPQVQDWLNRLSQVLCPRYVNECQILFETINECEEAFGPLGTEQFAGCTIFNPVGAETCIDAVRTSSCDSFQEELCDVDTFLNCP